MYFMLFNPHCSQVNIHCQIGMYAAQTDCYILLDKNTLHTSSNPNSMSLR